MSLLFGARSATPHIEYPGSGWEIYQHNFTMFGQVFGAYLYFYLLEAFHKKIG